MASDGFSRSVIYRWLKAAKGRGKGLRTLASRKGTGRPRKLTAEQERQVFRWINGKNPRQYPLDGVLWSRAIVRELIQRELGVSLSLASVGSLLARLGLTPQKPLQRAYQRNPEAIERWKRETYPAITQEARETQADIYFWDESGFRADAVHGKTGG
jgi:transposase